jgi:hypothetical protein
MHWWKEALKRARQKLTYSFKLCQELSQNFTPSTHQQELLNSLQPSAGLPHRFLQMPVLLVKPPQEALQ